MRKKIFAIYALVGALVASPIFTSCVDSEESASVTAQRELNASKIKALTALYNAQADAEKAKADAEVALKTAEAAYQQAMAEAKKAEAADKVRQTQEAQEKFALEIEKIKAEYAEQIAEYNASKVSWENTLWSNTESHISTVYNYYNNAAQNVNTLNETLLKQLTLKSLAESNAVTAEQSLKQTIADLNEEKIQKERELAKWTAIKAQQPTKDDYLAMLDSLEILAYDLKQNKIPAVEAAEETAKEAYDAAKEAYNENEAVVAYMEAFKALNGASVSVDLQAAIEDHWNRYDNELKYSWQRYIEDRNLYYQQRDDYWAAYWNAQDNYNSDWKDWDNNGQNGDAPEWSDYAPEWSDYVTMDYPYWENYAPNREEWKAGEPKAEDFEGKFGTYEEYIVVEDSVEKFVEAFGYTPNGFRLSIPVLTEKESNVLYGTIEFENNIAAALETAENYIKQYTGEAWEMNDDDEIVLSNDWNLAADGVNFEKWGWADTEDVKGHTLYSVKDVEGMIAYRKQLIAAQKEDITAKKDDIAAAKTAKKTEAEIALLENELKALEEKLAQLEDMRLLNAHLVWAKEQVAFYTEQKAELEETQKTLAANLATIKDNTAITEALEALEETAVAYLDALTETEVLETALKEIGGSSVTISANGISMNGGLYADIKALLDGIVDVQELIDACNERLQEIENTVKLGNLNNLVTLTNTPVYMYDWNTGYTRSVSVKQYVLNGTKGDYTYEDALAVIEAQIAYLKKQIEIQEAMAKKYEAELDALLGLGAETEA